MAHRIANSLPDPLAVFRPADWAETGDEPAPVGHYYAFTRYAAALDAAGIDPADAGPSDDCRCPFCAVTRH